MQEEVLRKYARFLIKNCLKLKEGQPLLVAGQTLNQDFMNLILEEAKKLNSGEVYLDVKDRFAERELFLHESYETIIQSPLLDRHLYNEVTLQGGALLSLASPIPHINEGVDAELLRKLSMEIERRISVFREKSSKGLVPWCIAAASNPYWAKEILPEESNPEMKLWEIILDICCISSEDPGKIWEDYFAKLDERCRILNNAQIKSLHYKSSNGTDIIFELPESYVFQSAKDSEFIVNMPSLEMFTTPYREGVNGIVYSSKPLFHNGVEICDFFIRFEKGRVVEAKAKKNDEMLQQIIHTDEGSHYLGEVALVDYDSRINQSGILFQHTLYDENACCHLALGRGFAECFQDGYSKTKEELIELGMNDSSTHVDFMVGTRDLEIVATLRNGEKMQIMKYGKIVF